MTRIIFLSMGLCQALLGREVSEYHYYEFQAIDRALTQSQIRELR
jgi:hypothetical protein